MDVGRSGNAAQPVRNPLGDLIILRLAPADDLDVDGGRQTEVQNLADDVRGLEEELHAREPGGQFFAQLFDVFGGGPMFFLVQRNQNFRVRGADTACRAVGVVDRAVGQADVVENRDQFFRRNLLPDRILHFITEPGRFFDSQPRASAHMHAKGAGIDFGKEVLAQEKDESQRQKAEAEEAGNENPAMLHGPGQHAMVSIAHELEAALKADLQALERSEDVVFHIELVFVLMSAQQVHDQGGYQGPRKQVRGEHGEHHGLGQRNEKKFGYAGQEEHGHKHDADTQRGNEGGHGNLRCAIQNGGLQIFAHGQVAVDVFNFNRGVVHEDSDRQGQPSEGHEVEGLAERGERDDRAENRKRNGDGDDQRAAPVAEEQKDHGGGKAGRCQSFAHHALDRGTHEQRLVEQGLHLQVVGQGRRNPLQAGFDVADDVESGSAAVAHDGDQRSTLDIVSDIKAGLKRI